MLLSPSSLLLSSLRKLTPLVLVNSIVIFFLFSSSATGVGVQVCGKPFPFFSPLQPSSVSVAPSPFPSQKHVLNTEGPFFETSGAGKGCSCMPLLFFPPPTWLVEHRQRAKGMLRELAFSFFFFRCSRNHGLLTFLPLFFFFPLRRRRRRLKDFSDHIIPFFFSFADLEQVGRPVGHDPFPLSDRLGGNRMSNSLALFFLDEPYSVLLFFPPRSDEKWKTRAPLFFIFPPALGFQPARRSSFFPYQEAGKEGRCLVPAHHNFLRVRRDEPFFPPFLRIGAD